jgi:hypothetical protein
MTSTNHVAIDGGEVDVAPSNILVDEIYSGLDCLSVRVLERAHTFSSEGLP